jgi:hypothetical protein
MWSLIVIAGIVGIILIARVWVYGDDPAEPIESKPSGPGAGQDAKSGPESFNVVHYRLGRWDMFGCSVNFCLHNRLVQAVFLLGLLFIEWIVISDAYSESESIWPVVMAAVMAPIIVLCVVGLLGSLVLVLISFLFSHKGILGEHTLEITDRGLLERTEFNETLVKWRGIGRVHSSARYVYIYVSDFNYYAVPKRQFTVEYINAFEATLREGLKGKLPVMVASS